MAARVRAFGPIVRNWEQNRCVPWRAKITALVMMFGVAQLDPVRGAARLAALSGLGLIAIGCAVVLSLRTARAAKAKMPPAGSGRARALSAQRGFASDPAGSRVFECGGSVAMLAVASVRRGLEERSGVGSSVFGFARAPAPRAGT